MHLLPTTRHIQTVKNNSVSPGAYIFSLDISLFSNKNWKDFLNNIFRSNLADNEIKSRFCSFKRCYMDGQIIWHRCDTNSPVIVKNPLFAVSLRLEWLYLRENFYAHADILFKRSNHDLFNSFWSCYFCWLLIADKKHSQPGTGS